MQSCVRDDVCGVLCVRLGQTDTMAFEGLSPAPLDLSSLLLKCQPGTLFSPHSSPPICEHFFKLLYA